MNRSLVFGTLLLLVLVKPLHAQYVPAPWPDVEPEFESAFFMRAGVTVRDVDESLAFFRDVLGMTVIVDRMGMFDPRLPAFSGLKSGETIRLTILRAETKGSAKVNGGYIALSERYDADGNKVPPPANVPSKGSAPGSIMLQFLVDDVRPIHREVERLGFEIISAPQERDDGTRSELLVRDHNGIRYWITDRYSRTLFLEQSSGD